MNRLTIAIVLLAACGDNHATPDASTSDAPSDAGHVPVPQALAAAGDFGSPGTGVLSRLDITRLDMRTNLVPAAASGDPVLRYIDGKIYVINRFGANNVTILDAKKLQLEEQISTGVDSNPQDVAVVGNKLYVPAMGTAGVVVLTRGQTTTKTIDLSSLDSMGMNDGKPDCVSAYAVGTKVYVACGLADNFVYPENAKVAVIDTATDTLITSVAMNNKNPYGFFVRAPMSSQYAGDLLIATVPSFSSFTTGCIERVTPGDAPTVQCGLTNMELGGFANKLSVAPDGELLYVAVGTYDLNFSNPTGKLRGYDLNTGMLWPGAISADSELIVDVAACPGGDVAATDQKLNAGGLRVWSGTEERTMMPLSIGMPPTVNALVCYDP